MAVLEQLAGLFPTSKYHRLKIDLQDLGDSAGSYTLSHLTMIGIPTWARYDVHRKLHQHVVSGQCSATNHIPRGVVIMMIHLMSEQMVILSRSPLVNGLNSVETLITRGKEGRMGAETHTRNGIPIQGSSLSPSRIRGKRSSPDLDRSFTLRQTSWDSNV